MTKVSQINQLRVQLMIQQFLLVISISLKIPWEAFTQKKYNSTWLEGNSKILTELPRGSQCLKLSKNKIKLCSKWNNSQDPRWTSSTLWCNRSIEGPKVSKKKKPRYARYLLTEVSTLIKRTAILTRFFKTRLWRTKKTIAVIISLKNATSNS